MWNVEKPNSIWKVTRNVCTQRLSVAILKRLLLFRCHTMSFAFTKTKGCWARLKKYYSQCHAEVVAKEWKDSRRFRYLTLESASKLIIAVKKELFCWKDQSFILKTKCRSNLMIVANKTLFGVEKKKGLILLSKKLPVFTPQL